jgi:hypothetical protein
MWEGRLSMADCKSGAYFVQECLLDHLLNGDGAGVSTHNFSDNTPTVGWINRHTSGRIPLHRGDATLPRHMEAHHRERPGRFHPLAGQGNLMGNIPSRSFEEGFPKGMDDQFLAHFTY